MRIVPYLAFPLVDSGVAGREHIRPGREKDYGRCAEIMRAHIHGIGFQQPPDDKPVAHVALVYTSLEGVGPGLPGIAVEAEASLVLGHYASVAGAIRLVAGDAWAALHEHSAAAPPVVPSPSLRPSRASMCCGGSGRPERRW